MTQGISGPSSPVSFAFYDPESSSLRTSQATFDLDSTVSSLTLPNWGSMRNGELYEQPTSERPTAERDFSSLLGTPTARDWKDGIPQDAVEVNGLLGRQVWSLLPTPTGDDANNVTRASGTFESLARTAHSLSPNGESTPPPSDDGNKSSVELLPDQLTFADA